MDLMGEEFQFDGGDIWYFITNKFLILLAIKFQEGIRDFIVNSRKFAEVRHFLCVWKESGAKGHF